MKHHIFGDAGYTAFIYDMKSYVLVNIIMIHASLYRYTAQFNSAIKSCLILKMNNKQT